MKTYKQFVAEARENSLDEGWRDYIPSADQVSAFGRNFADKATLGGYKYARAGADYVVKKAMGKKTTYKKELDQEKEKLKAGEKKYPGTTVAADLAGHVAPGIVAPEVTAIAKGAQGVADMATSMYPRVKKAIVGEDLKTYRQFVAEAQASVVMNDTKTKTTTAYKTPEQKPAKALDLMKAATPQEKRPFPDRAQPPQTPRDKLNMMRMKSDVEFDRFSKKMDADFADKSSKTEPKRVSIGDTGIKKSAAPAMPKAPKPPTPKARPKDLDVTKSKDFGTVFKAMKAAGKKEFTWTNPRTGKSMKYSTKTKK